MTAMPCSLKQQQEAKWADLNCMTEETGSLLSHKIQWQTTQRLQIRVGEGSTHTGKRQTLRGSDLALRLSRIIRLILHSLWKGQCGQGEPLSVQCLVSEMSQKCLRNGPLWLFPANIDSSLWNSRDTASRLIFYFSPTIYRASFIGGRNVCL